MGIGNGPFEKIFRFHLAIGDAPAAPRLGDAAADVDRDGGNVRHHIQERHRQGRRVEQHPRRVRAAARDSGPAGLPETLVWRKGFGLIPEGSGTDA